ncbi:Hpt domain-containing protein [Candidatus Thiothrix sp. Deng01]|uniref:Hpt domain-containing protein n=1 Tax=Candidatus Thiothrix phosphatis TaxID=3112415 RepID=A0ABU6D0U9_9GAMM|nr:Hpt domain-containing protein [Candidatus Thiothrix sp. Deng01]MEB4592710.1 Hpt domain-containing protein [Candidatus Thiothrix sp. Deng01]
MMPQMFIVLDEIAGRLGREKAIEIVEFSLPYIAGKEQQLRDALQAGDWETAARHAHKAISSVRLFGSVKLEALLRQIKDGDSGLDAGEVQQALSAEFAQVEASVHSWLAANAGE